MIEDKFVDLYAHNSGLRDKLVAERDVVLTYALRGLTDEGVMAHLAFKGGTCLRKMIFGSAGRFSEDLDFTLDTERAEDDVLLELVGSLNREHYGITFALDQYYKTDRDTSFGGDVMYRHAWNDAGRFRLQVSLRERPTLPAVQMAMQHQAYFNHLEIDLFKVRSLQVIEMIAEKVRATYQRAKVRDLYELGDETVVRTMGEIAELADTARDLLQAGDHEGLARLIDRNFDLRAGIFPIRDEDLAMVRTARSTGASCKFCGSGGAVVGTYTGEAMLAELRAAMAGAGYEFLVPHMAPTD